MGVTIPATGIGDQTPVIATESNAVGHFQFFKLVDGNVGSTSPLATSANPVFVQFPGAQSVSQGSPPWTVVGSVFMSPASMVTQSSITAFQGGAWAITGSVFASPLSATVIGSVNANVVNTISVLQANSPWITQNQGSVTAFQGNAPWTVTGSVGATVLGGNVAHDTSDTGNPIKVGGFAINSEFPVAVNSGDRVNFVADLKGRQIVTGVPQGLMQSHDNDWVGPLSGSVVWSAAPNAKINITNLVITAGSGTAGLVTVFFARSGSTVMPTVGSGVVAFKAEFAPSATVKPGAVVPFGMFPCQPGSPSDALRIAISTSMQIYLQVKGYEEL